MRLNKPRKPSVFTSEAVNEADPDALGQVTAKDMAWYGGSRWASSMGSCYGERTTGAGRVVRGRLNRRAR